MEKRLCPYCMNDIEGKKICPHCNREWKKFETQPHHLPTGTLLDNRYYIGASLGEGGFGITYIGYDLKLKRKLAIKEYYPRQLVTRFSKNSVNVTYYTGSEEKYSHGKEQFLREAQSLALLSEIPEVVNVIDYFPANQTAYIVMEYLEGTTLYQLVKKNGKIPINDLLVMLEPVIKGIDAVHKAGMIHRDISPDNLMLMNKSKKIKVMDFGCARDVEANYTMSVMLKQGYAPMEQYFGRNQGPWTDVYALCASIYFCITGKKPPDATSRIEEDELIKPSELTELSSHQEKVILKGLAINKEKRYQSMADLYKAFYGDSIDIPIIIENNIDTVANDNDSDLQVEETQQMTDEMQQSKKEDEKTEIMDQSSTSNNKRKIGLFLLLVMLIIGGLGFFVVSHEHSYGDWKTVKAAQCFEEGEEERKCSCGKVESRSIKQIGKHKEKKLDSIKSTCTKEGKEQGVICEICDKVLTPQKIIPATGHDMGKVARKEATCTEDGYESYEGCKKCGYTSTKKKVIKALGHQEVKMSETTATCLKEGTKGGTKCSRCNKVIKQPQKIAKAAHKEAKVPDVMPTCTTEGKKGEIKCSVCNTIITKGQIVAKKEHVSVKIPATKATCSKTGLTEGSKCQTCGTILKAQTTIAKIKHSFTKGACSQCGIVAFASGHLSASSSASGKLNISADFYPTEAAGHYWEYGKAFIFYFEIVDSKGIITKHMIGSYNKGSYVEQTVSDLSKGKATIRLCDEYGNVYNSKVTTIK